MFGFHWEELLIVLVLGLLVFGPKRLPEIGRGLGQSIRDFRRHVSEDDTTPEQLPPPSGSADRTG